MFQAHARNCSVNVGEVARRQWSHTRRRFHVDARPQDHLLPRIAPDVAAPLTRLEHGWVLADRPQRLLDDAALEEAKLASEIAQGEPRPRRAPR